MMIRLLSAVLIIFVITTGCSGLRREPGDDVVRVFHRAGKGSPIRCVAFGSGITYAGSGWIGSWLEKQFPASRVVMKNAGLAGTNSELAPFRFHRDVLSFQPHLVLIEFTVADRLTPSAEVIRSLETVIRKLKTLPDSPAVIFVHAAMRQGADPLRHSRLAGHYGLFEIDLQKQVAEYLEREKLEWEDLFTDFCHPNQRGHAFYRESITQKLFPLLQKARRISSAPEKRPVPSVLSSLRLLDGAGLATIEAAGDFKSQTGLPTWKDRYFLGAISASEPGAAMSTSFRGRTAGIVYDRGPDAASFYVSIDGRMFHEVVPGGYGIGHAVFTRDLAPGEHILNLVIPPDAGGSESARLGYLLYEKEAHADPHGLIRPGDFTPENMKSLRRVEIPGRKWAVAGPFGKRVSGWSPSKGLPEDFTAKYGPDTTDFKGHASDPEGSWRSETGENGQVTFRQAPGTAGGVFYARTILSAQEDGEFFFRLKANYFAQVRVNGKVVYQSNGLRGDPSQPVIFPARLENGPNMLQVKIAPAFFEPGFSLGVYSAGKEIGMKSPLVSD